MQAEDYYQLLGVNRRASTEKLRHAFRARMLELHPDLHPNDSLACEQTRTLVEAYKTLSDPKARLSYDRSVARPEIQTLDWSYSESEEAAPWLRQALTMLFAAFAMVLLIWAVRTAADTRRPVHKFHLTELWTDLQPQRVALLVDPEIRNGLEWYQTVEYQMSSQSALVSQGTSRVYERAVRAAERRGDRACAQFYRESLSEVRRAQTAGPAFGAPTEANRWFGANPDEKTRNPGAKPTVESS